LPGSEIPGGQNLTGILPRMLHRRKNPGSQSLAGKQIPGSQNLTGIPNANLNKILAKKQIPGGQNLGAILLGIAPIFVAESDILGKILSGNLGKISVMLPRISFGAIIF